MVFGNVMGTNMYHLDIPIFNFVSLNLIFQPNLIEQQLVNKNKLNQMGHKRNSGQLDGKVKIDFFPSIELLDFPKHGIR